MRRMRSGSWARAALPNAAAEPTTTLTKSRRLIAAPEAKGQGIVQAQSGRLEAGDQCPLCAKSRHLGATDYLVPGDTRILRDSQGPSQSRPVRNSRGRDQNMRAPSTHRGARASCAERISNRRAIRDGDVE